MNISYFFKTTIDKIKKFFSSLAKSYKFLELNEKIYFLRTFFDMIKEFVANFRGSKWKILGIFAVVFLIY